MKIAIFSAFAIVAFTRLGSADTIITGTLTGVVADEYGYTANNATSVSNSDSTNLFGGGTLNGDPFTLSYSYDATAMTATGNSGYSLLNTASGGGGFFDESLSIVTNTGTYALTVNDGAGSVAYTCANAADVTGGCVNYNEYEEYSWDNPGDGLFVESYFFNYDTAPAADVTTQAFVDTVLEDPGTYTANPPVADSPVSFSTTSPIVYFGTDDNGTYTTDDTFWVTGAVYTSTPEPGTLFLLAVGLAGLAMLKFQRRIRG